MLDLIEKEDLHSRSWYRVTSDITQILNDLEPRTASGHVLLNVHGPTFGTNAEVI